MCSADSIQWRDIFETNEEVSNATQRNAAQCNAMRRKLRMAFMKPAPASPFMQTNGKCEKRSHKTHLHEESDEQNMRGLMNEDVFGHPLIHPYTVKVVKRLVVIPAPTRFPS
jgi:hypothetical protein